MDSQIKLRGLRIELGEIESLLASHASIKEAVVIVLGEGGQQKLSAYVVVSDERRLLPTNSAGICEPSYRSTWCRPPTGE